MRVSARTHRVQWDLHSLVGLVAALPLFVVFFCGSVAIFADDLVVWQDATLHTSTATDDPSVYDDVVEALEEQGLLTADASVSISRVEGTGHLRVMVDGDEHGGWWFEPGCGGLSPVRSRASESMVELHFLEPMIGGLQIAGLLGIALLVLTASGVVLVLKGFLRNAWRFRPQLARKRWSVDAHKALGILSAPFVLVMAFSGALLGVGTYLGGGLAYATYDGDISQLQTIRGYGPAAPVPQGEEATTLPLERIVRAGQASVGERSLPEYVGVQARGDAAAHATLFWPSELGSPWRYVFVDATTAEVRFDTSHAWSPSQLVEEPAFAIHFGWFGAGGTKVAFLVLGLTVCVLIVAGQVVWLERRAARRATRWNRGVAAATAGGCAGLVLATSALFACARLSGEAGSPALEWKVFLGVWAAAVAYAFLRARNPGAVASTLLWIAAVAFLGVVVHDLALLPSNLLTAVGQGRLAVWTGNAVMLALGLAAMAAAKVAGSRWANR